MNDEYTEKDYWEGKVPDDKFDEYLKKYGYEYTPTDDDFIKLHKEFDL